MEFKNYWIFLGILSGLLFGIATPFSKILLNNLNSFQLSGLLYIGSSIVILPSFLKKLYNYYINEKKIKIKNINKNDKYLANIRTNIISKTIHKKNSSFKIDIQDFLKNIFTNNNLNLLLILLFGGVLGPLFLMIGLSSIMASSAAIWLNMELVTTAILGIIIFKDYLDKYSVIGLILTFTAGLIISWGGGFGEIIPIIFIIIACFAWGADNQLTSIVDGYSPEFITFLKGTFGGGINLTIGMFLASFWIPLDILIYALLLGVISYGLSIVFFVSSAQNLGATRSQILFSTAPFWGILLSILIIGDPLTLNIIIATCFLLAGILITNNLVHSHEHTHIEIEHIHLHSHDDIHHNHRHNMKNGVSIEKNDVDSKRKHIHSHKHINTQHKHRHFPDLHHKHNH